MERHSALSLLDEKDLQSLVQSEIVNEDVIHTRIVDDVEIDPPIMTFMDAYEGKEFSKRITLQNKGSRTASVRIGSPTAKTFQLKPMENVCRLPPGLSLSRMIRMKYSRTFAVHDAQIPIYINNVTIQYPLSIYLNQARIIVEPMEVNFGRIDAVSGIVNKNVIVKNVGTKNTGFCIDLGRNELELIVEPTKGVLQANESVTLKLEMMGFYEGPFEKEFWIKTSPPKRVTVIGEFITPKIIPTYPKAYADFTMINFPRLYIGQTATRTLMLKNISSSDVMFCIKGFFDKRYFLYKEVQKVHRHSRSFELTPLEGRLKSQQTFLVEVRFEPQESTDNHAVSFLQVIRVNCTDVDDSVIIRANEAIEQTFLGPSERSRSSLMSVTTNMPQIAQDDDLMDEIRAKAANQVTDQKMIESETFRVCLYGDLEKAKVKIRPECISLNHIRVNDEYFRDIWFENASNYLPIIIDYVKTAFIEVKPKRIFLKPKETREVVLKIQTRKAGYCCSLVKFQLLVFENYDYGPKREKVVVGEVEIKVSFTGMLMPTMPGPKFVTGLTPFNHNEVGFMTDGIKFNSPVKKPRAAMVDQNANYYQEKDALIAFPNDRPQSLRPWKEENIKTIFAKIPRNTATYDEYSYSPTTLVMKHQNNDKYLDYLRERQQRRNTEGVKKSSFEITRKWMFEKYICENIEEKAKKLNVIGFVPLSPIVLHNIKISPKYIRLQRVAPISNVENQFTIMNDNSFPIFVYVTSVKPGIYFQQGQCKVVNPNEKRVVTLVCFAGLVGRYINLIQVIVNFCHLYTISVMVEVVPKMINLDENVLNFEPERSGQIKFIELQNHLNSSISFTTEMSMSRYSIEPPSGTILQKRSLICAIRYENKPELPDYCELVLTSEGGGAQILQISRKKERPNVDITPPRLTIPSLPFNIQTQHIIRVRNAMNYDICYLITEPSPLEGVEIFPFEGVIEAVAEITLTVTIIVNSSLFVDTKFHFVFDDQYAVILPVQGKVVLPSVDIRPETITNRQLIPSAYRRNMFYVKNESVCECFIRFDLDQYEYFRVTEKELDMDTTTHNKNLKFLPGEVKTLYLHFNPMDALTESFYMPIVINDIIGPPTMSNVDSLCYSMVDAGRSDETKLPCLKITSICSTTTLHFSTLKLTFSYALPDTPSENLRKFFTTKNFGNDPVEFCIRTNKMLPQFSLTYHSGASVQETHMSIVCRLNPGESTIFAARFIPGVPGLSNNSLPIYVRNYLDGCIFNYLRLIGRYEYPSITTIQENHFMGCTPVGFKSTAMFELSMRHHDEKCQVYFDPPPPDVTITFRERVKKNKNIVKTKILVLFFKPGYIFTDIIFRCTCEASCVIKLIAFCDSSYLSHYAFFGNNKDFFRDNLVPPAKNFEFGGLGLQNMAAATETVLKPSPSEHMSNVLGLIEYHENQNVVKFPFFPLEEDEENDTDYHIQLRETKKFVERWVCSQGFYKTRFFKIPYTIALPPVEKHKDIDRKETVLEPVILTFLVELGGIPIREASITSKINQHNEKNIALHFFTTYTNMLKYLENSGAIFPHVLPELLLTYEQYEIMFTYFPNSMKIKTRYCREDFHAYSTRCYLDVILQSIKIFILTRIKMFTVEINPDSSEEIVSDERLSGISVCTPVSCQVSMVKPNSLIYTKGEHMLLYWLQYHYDNQKNKLRISPDEFISLKPKELKIFGEEMNDSLVFACVTLAYCPYLGYVLTDMYLPPATSEEYHHNACVIIKAWNLLKLSYHVDPKDIVEPNGVNMLLLTLYLYEILPSFYPKEVLNLEAKLTETTRATISLTNSSDHLLLYAVSFFNNEFEAFTSETEVFKIQSKKTGTLKIKYQAKKIMSHKAIVVLSGELPGQKYGRSRAIYLNGVTDLHHSIQRVQYKCECYVIYKMKIHLVSPYKVPDTYEIFYAIVHREGDETEEFQLFSWKEYILGKIPKRIYSREYSFTVTNPEQGFYFQPIICCQMLLPRVYKMFMVGTHGDWCFEIKLVPKMSKQTHEVINVSLPRGFNNQVCSCRDKTTEIPLVCPRTIHINIPCKNNLVFKATREMFIACTDEQFAAFWRKYLPMRTVFNIVKSLYFADVAGMKVHGVGEFLQRTRIFNIHTEANSTFTTSKQVVIEDVISESTTDILIHARPDFDPNTGNILELVTQSGMEKRYYKLNFYES